ncbi:hypothetical protein [Mesorhizobium sp. M0047]|uniref:hypothetical protein n=1 Tax=Mesorhizobium sp. M0047 TaxID=2956859 RepID=UPI00333BAB59
MQHLADCLQQIEARIFMPCGRIAAEVMYGASSRRRSRSRGGVQSRPRGHQLSGMGRPEPRVGCASVPEVGVPENRQRASRKRTEIEEKAKCLIPQSAEDEAALATPFVKCLVRMIRAQESYCSWEGKSDATLLADFIVIRKAPSDPWHGLPRSGRAVEARFVLHRRRLAIAERLRPVTSPIVEMKP